MSYHTPDANHFSLSLEVWAFQNVSDEWSVDTFISRAHSNDAGVRDGTDTLFTDDCDAS